jgi:LacI family transcriptional regulator, gluconate utilization system Gnt-I transcriptional repressor
MTKTSSRQVLKKNQDSAATAVQSQGELLGVSLNKRVSITDVAKIAGVGTMTVSRAINRPEMVSDALRKRILAVVDELGYIPNRVAGGLASGTSRAVPVILPTLNHSVYVAFLEGLCSLLPDQGYQILLATSEYKPEVEEKLIATLLGWRPDGIVLSGVNHSKRAKSMLKQAHIPVIEIMDLTDHPIDMNVGFSHRAIGCAVGEYLIAKGYKQIAHAGSFAQHDVRAAHRVEGLQETLKKAGLPFGYVQNSNQPSSIGLGRELLSALLQRHPEVQAVFFANDDLAAGALFEAVLRGIRVPQELAIIGFNDQEIASQVSPALTSVVTPRFEMGRLAADMLLRRMRGERVDVKKMDLGFQIIERASS